MSRCWGCSQENCEYGGICSCSCHKAGGKHEIYDGVGRPYHPEDWTGYVERCSKHKRYQAKRKPTGNCEACWRYYVAANP